MGKISAHLTPGIRPNQIAARPGTWTARFTLLLAIGATAGCAAGTGFKDRPVAMDLPSAPIVAVETGMHIDNIRRIDVDQQERFLISGSDDKTVRVWDLRDGRLLNTIRVPMAPSIGFIHAVALSPDGRLIAASGLTNPPGEPQQIYVFDRASGELLRRIEALPIYPMDLEFSQDGRFLAAILGLAHGLRVYRTADFAEVARDPDYSGHSLTVDFAADGRVVTTSWDGVRLYDRNFSLLAKTLALGSLLPTSAAFSPDGREIAVGYLDITNVDILSATDLAPRHRTDTSSYIPTVAWSEDGRLCTAGVLNPQDLDFRGLLRCWQARGRGSYEDSTFAATNTISDLKPLQGGGFAVSALDPMIAVLDDRSTSRWTQRGEKADFRNAASAFAVSEHGDVVVFGFGLSGERLARISLRDLALELNPTGDESLYGARTEAPGLAVENWISFEPTLNGEPLPLDLYEMSRSLAIAPDGDRFVLGADWSLRAFDNTGRQLWSTVATSTAWSVTITGDGRTVVAGHGDGTIRWYDMKDGRELLAFFPHPDGERWVAWLPEGFFAASEGGAELIGYHINRGWDRPPDFVRIEQLFERYYRPELVEHRLDRNEAPIRTALATVGDVDALLLSTRPPSVELLGPEVVAIDRRRFVHEVALSDEGGGIGQVVYRVNGVRIDPVDTRTEERRRGNLILRKQPLDLKQGRNVIEVRAYTKDGAVASAPVQQVAEVDDPLARPPTLYGLAIGIDDYFDSALGLRYATNDARTVKRTLEERGRRLYADVDIRLLSDRQASKEGIRAAFRNLAATVGPNDVFVLYVSGHGFADEGRYYFVPQEVGYTNAAALRAGSLSEADLVGLLEGIKAQKSLVVLDTCYAGAFDTIGPFASARGLEEKAAIDRLMRATGRAFLGASTDRDLALEGYQGHGLYTYTLIAGMRGEADRWTGNRNGAVSVLELAQYLDDLVPDLSQRVFGRTQVPMHQLSGQSFAVTAAE